MDRRALLLLAVLLLAGPLLAEVSVTPQGRPVVLVKDGVVWAPVRHGVDSRFLLNPWGDVRGDGAPDLQVSPASGYPEVVWASRQGGGHEIAFARWTGERWETSVVTSDPADDLLPEIHHDAWGNRFILWVRQDQASGIFLAASPPGRPDFNHPLRLNAAGREAFEPSLAIGDGGQVLLSWIEVDHGGGLLLRLAEVHPACDWEFVLLGGGDIPEPTPLAILWIRRGGEEIPEPTAQAFLKHSLGGGDIPEPTALAPVLRGGGEIPEPTPLPRFHAILPLQPRVHAEAGAVWVDWIQRGRQGSLSMAYAAFDGVAFGEVLTVPMRDATVRGLDSARAEVRRRILGPAAR